MSALSVTPANVLASANATKQTGVAGATITAGQALYVDTANGNVMKLLDADAVAPANVYAGIALHGSLTGQPITYVLSDPTFTPGATLVSGDTIWTSATAGGITKTAADNSSGVKVTVIGSATSSTVMNLSPQLGIVGGTV